MIRWTLAVFLACTASSAYSDSLGPTVAKDGNWELHKTKDGFSDAISCTITLSKKQYFQVSNDKIYINYAGRGGAISYQYRLDEKPISEMILPPKHLRYTGLVELDDAVLKQTLNADRLRVQIVTTNSLATEDVQLKGLARLYNRMRSECP